MRMRLLQASLGLLTCVPCYEGLTEASPRHAPLWLVDAVLATRMQFLMAMLAPCLSQLPQVRFYEALVQDVCIPSSTGPVVKVLLWLANAMLLPSHT